MANLTELNGAAFDLHRDLVEQCKKGDRVAQYRIYKLYAQAMYNVCLRIIADEQEAKDVLQESFIKAFTQLGKFRGDSTFGLWLKRIVVNQSISVLRKKRPVLVDLEDLPISDLPDEEMPESLFRPEWVNEAIRSLPDKARTIFPLFSLEGYRNKEIAEELQITESTSKTQYHRARMLLQEKLNRKLHETHPGILS